MSDPVPGIDDPVLRVLRPLLADQLRRLRARFLVHGVCVTLAVVAGALLFAFGLDHWLRLPAPIRLFHTAAIVALLVFTLLRFVRYPLSRRFAEVDLALWLERTFPALHQRLVSAVQLHAVRDDQLRNQSREMIDQLLTETATAVRGLPLQQLFDGRRTGRFALAAMLLVATALLGAMLAPTTAATFLLRQLGFNTEYPRETTLRIELPPPGPDLQVEERDGTTELVLPAGADLHVSVLATGTVPKDVFLDVRTLREGRDEEARAVTMTPRPGDRFRHVFRRLSGSFEFHARGGDDDHGDRLVIVHTVHPPQVASLRAVIHPPAYTGIAELTQNGGAIEALIGSEIELFLTTTMPVRSAAMVFLENGRRIDLTPTAVQDDSAAATVYRAQWTLEGSDRYQCELLGANGLRNPNPGTYPIAALQDYAPVARWLLPDEDSFALLPTGILCVRVQAKDDFGLEHIELTADRAGETTLRRELLPPAAAPTATPGPRPTTALPTELFEVSELLRNGAAENDSLVLMLRLTDNRQPEPGTTELPRRIVPIVDGPQLAGIIGKTFRGLREEVSQCLDIQTDRHARLEELVARADQAAGANFTAGELTQQLTGIEVGQGRIGSAMERVQLGLMRAFDLHLWNRLETSKSAAQVVDLYLEHSRSLQEPLAVDPAFYRDLLARRTAGSLGAMETTLDPILAMIQIADRLTAVRAPALNRTLAEAQVARDAADRAPRLTRALTEQKSMEADLQQLLLRLEEWNDYQDMVQEVRALRDKQRELQGRTEDTRGKQ